MLFCFVKRGWEEGGFKAAIAVMQGNYHVGCRGLKAALNIPHLSKSFVSRQSQNNGGWSGSAAGTPTPPLKPTTSAGVPSALSPSQSPGRTSSTQNPALPPPPAFGLAAEEQRHWRLVSTNLAGSIHGHLSLCQAPHISKMFQKWAVG